MGSKRSGSSRSAPFLVVAVVLAVSALGLDTTLDRLRVRFEKEPVALRVPFAEFESRELPSFSRKEGSAMIEVPEEVAGIGTEEWADVVYQLRSGELSDSRDGYFGDSLLLLSYYSDPRDQVAHTPEVCYRQAGATVLNMTKVPLFVEGLAGGRTVSTRLVEFDFGKANAMVLYVFICNGRFYDDRERMRWAIGWPGDKHIYFAKIEAVATFAAEENRDGAVDLCRRLLAEALPVLKDDFLPMDELVRGPQSGP